MSNWKMGDPPAEVSDAEVVFPADGGALTPPYGDLPDDVKGFRGQWSGLAEALFSGCAADVQMLAAEGIDSDKAWRHLRCVLGTFATKHEHKIAGAAWLLREWFPSVRYSEHGRIVEINWPEVVAS